MSGRKNFLDLQYISIYLTPLFVILFLSALLRADVSYRKVKIQLNTPEDIQQLHRIGIAADHFSRSSAGALELILDDSEVALLEAQGIVYETIIANMRQSYRERQPLSGPDRVYNEQLKSRDNVNGFDFGSMGGFYTYDEVNFKLDSMQILYPGIITVRTSIGQSIEGRDIWMVKISDNPDMDEDEAAIYFDALHHCREPGSMASTLYYMFWLLENYGDNPRATYLVDNREMFFVPVVNPDGYVYNESTDPQGGGLWRKNRRDNGGGCYGVDLNRNYSFGWGNDDGSSSDSCSNIYRGEKPFSEPETEAIRALLEQIQPEIAFSTHTYGEKFLNPYGYTQEAPEYNIYSEFSSSFLSGSSYLYGITYEMLGYISSGTTRDYMHSQGIYGWTPELGANNFWPPEQEIIPIVSENRGRFEYISWVGGAFADFQNATVGGTGAAIAGDTLTLLISVKNRGLSASAENVTVSAATDYPYIETLTDTISYGLIAARQILENSSMPFRFVIGSEALLLDEISFSVSVSQEGVETSRDTLGILVGERQVLFSDHAENGIANWDSYGPGQSWDSTFVDFYDTGHSFADSRYGNAENVTNSFLELKEEIDLSGTLHPFMEFKAKWSDEEGFDYSRVQVSVNGGQSWVTLSGEHTVTVQGFPGYTGTRHWVEERIDLGTFAGHSVSVRFQHVTDFGIPGDGFYFDRFQIVDYGESGQVGIPEKGHIPGGFSLQQNYPNPFNPGTLIRYQLSVNSSVRLDIYNISGERIRILVGRSSLKAENQPAGNYEVSWDGTNDLGQAVASGVYFYRLTVQSEIDKVRKMILLR